MSWMFLSRLAVEAMHDEQLRRHGGARGIRDENALETVLARAESKAAYEALTSMIWQLHMSAAFFRDHTVPLET